MRQECGPITEQFVGPLIHTVPSPVRWVVEHVLKLDKLDELYLEARRRGEGRDLASSVLDALAVRAAVPEADLLRIPLTGPVVVVSNHPFGMLDGMVLDAVLRRRRGDIKILANSLLCGIPELAEHFIPVDVHGREAGKGFNARYLRTALQWLQNGGLLAVFPAGEVASWRFKARRVVDPPWRSTAARLARMSSATTIPAWFSGSNSVGFHLAGLVHPLLRTAALPAELVNKKGTVCSVRFGRPLSATDLASFGDDRTITEHLRARSRLLSHSRPRTTQARAVSPSAGKAVPAAPANAAAVRREIASLEQQGGLLVENHEYAVYRAEGGSIPALIDELGRVRELTFRAVGEGTGRASDTDSFDPYYSHVILWHKAQQTVAGSYRLAWTDDVIRSRGVSGLYTSTLFQYDAGFFDKLGPAVELGRSFVIPEKQKEPAPLSLLWQGIGRCVVARAEAPILFGAVSISRDYCSASREMMVAYLSGATRRDPLYEFLRPRKFFRPKLANRGELRSILDSIRNMDDLGKYVSELECGTGVPVLLRHYMHLGGSVLAFNLDRKFSDVVDALLYVDLRRANSKVLQRFLGCAPGTGFPAKV